MTVASIEHLAPPDPGDVLKVDCERSIETLAARPYASKVSNFTQQQPRLLDPQELRQSNELVPEAPFSNHR